MKVLFALHDLGFADHIAIAHLSAIAKQGGHQTYFTMLEDLRPCLSNINPDVVAYSANVLGYKRTVTANTMARAEHQFISIMGGPQATFSPETFPQSGMDAYCVGEGDFAFRDFLENIKDFSRIPNLITRVSQNSVRPLITNVDRLPPADRDLVLANSWLGQASKKTFYATRGCPFSCAYCCNSYYHELYKGQAVVRRFSVERIIREMEDVRNKYRMDFVKLGDDCFTIKPDDWLESFCYQYRKRIGLPFNCYLRVDTIDEKMLALLRKAGCHSVNISVDSTSHHIREDVLNRRMRAEDITERLRMVRQFGIKTFVNYMLGVPESTLQDDLETIRQGHEGQVAWVNYTTAVPMERTKFFDYCIERGLLNPKTYQGDMSGCEKPSALDCFTPREKRIRFNIFLLGEFIARLPVWLRWLGIQLIKVIPPNRLFTAWNGRRYRYYMEHVIFKTKDHFVSPRFWTENGV